MKKTIITILIIFFVIATFALIVSESIKDKKEYNYDENTLDCGFDTVDYIFLNGEYNKSSKYPEFCEILDKNLEEEKENAKD